jgi:hypothetical protein
MYRTWVEHSFVVAIYYFVSAAYAVSAFSLVIILIPFVTLTSAWRTLKRARDRSIIVIDYNGNEQLYRKDRWRQGE